MFRQLFVVALAIIATLYFFDTCSPSVPPTKNYLRGRRDPSDYTCYL